MAAARALRERPSARVTPSRCATQRAVGAHRWTVATRPARRVVAAASVLQIPRGAPATECRRATRAATGGAPSFARVKRASSRPGRRRVRAYACRELFNAWGTASRSATRMAPGALRKPAPAVLAPEPSARAPARSGPTSARPTGCRRARAASGGPPSTAGIKHASARAAARRAKASARRTRRAAQRPTTVGRPSASRHAPSQGRGVPRTRARTAA